MYGARAKLFFQDVTMSVMHGEMLPIWWDIEADRIDMTNGCNGPSDEGKVLADSLLCSFTLLHGGYMFGEFDRPCLTNDWRVNHFLLLLMLS